MEPTKVSALNKIEQPSIVFYFLETVPFDERAAQIYGEIRATLERQGNVIGAMDMLIAAQAKALGLILVTNNINEFSRIQNLTIQNWVM